MPFDLKTCKQRGCKTEFASYTDRDYCTDHKGAKYEDPFEDWGDENNGENGGGRKRSVYESRHSSTGKWPEMRKAAKGRDNYNCQDCGMTDKEHRNSDEHFGLGLHVHHITPVREFDNPEDAHTLDNLVTLCDKCHKQRKH